MLRVGWARWVVVTALAGCSKGKPAMPAETPAPTAPGSTAPLLDLIPGGAAVVFGMTRQCSHAQLAKELAVAGERMPSGRLPEKLRCTIDVAAAIESAAGSVVVEPAMRITLVAAARGSGRRWRPA